VRHGLPANKRLERAATNWLWQMASCEPTHLPEKILKE
jgi:hypothetical protein